MKRAAKEGKQQQRNKFQASEKCNQREEVHYEVALLLTANKMFQTKLIHSFLNGDTDEAMAEETATTPAKKATKAPKDKKPKAKPSHPPTAQMVQAAIKSLKERGGSSLQAIKKYIAANYKVDVEKLSPFIKKYLKSAVASGALIQTKGKGASGSFKLSASKSAEKKPAAKKPKTPKKAKAGEKKKAKKPAGEAKKKATPKKAKAKTPKKEKKAKTPKKPQKPKPKKAAPKAKEATPKKK